MEIPEDVTSLSSSAAQIVHTLRRQGHDPAPLLDNAGISIGDCSDPNLRISTAKVQILWRQAVEATGDPAFGLQVARMFQPVALCGLGFALLASDTLLDALNRLVKYSHLINTLPDFRLEDTSTHVDLVVRVPYLGPNFQEAAVDAGLAIFLRIFQITAGNNIMPAHVAMQRPKPVDRRPYEDMFGPSIEYAAPANRLSFDTALVNSRLATANPQLARLSDQTVIDYLARYERTNLTMQVRARIIEQLPDGRPNQGEIARVLNTSRRSLQRRLKDEETNFKALLNDTQRELALQYIRDSNRTLGEIAYLLGFSEPSNFTRAFKRWTGKSPGEFREVD